MSTWLGINRRFAFQIPDVWICSMIFTFSCGWTVTISYILGTGFFEFCSIVWSPTWTNSLKDGFQTLQTASFLRLLSTQEVSWTQLSSSMARRWFCCLHHAHRGEIITCAMPHLTSHTHTHTRSEVKRKTKADNLTLLSLEAPSANGSMNKRFNRSGFWLFQTFSYTLSPHYRYVGNDLTFEGCRASAFNGADHGWWPSRWWPGNTWISRTCAFSSARRASSSTACSHLT